MELSDAWPLCLCTRLQSGLSELPLVPRITGLAFPRVHVVHAHSHTPQALVLLQLHANLDVLLVASWQELSQHVCAFTRALSQLPSKYAPLWGGQVETGQGWRATQMGFSKLLSGCPHSRLLRDSQAFSFCTAGHWTSGQQVTRDGSGLRGVWWRQIRQFNRVSTAVADAVVTAFPSPRLLQQVSPLHPSSQAQDLGSTYSHLCLL